jgi:predicted nucleic acid-binding protein
LLEYDRVLFRPQLGLPHAEVRTVLAYLGIPGPHVIHVAPGPFPAVSADPDDNHFLAAALAGAATASITGNTKHVPESPWHDVSIVPPAAFLQRFFRD